MRTALVTGAAGTIGQGVVASLVASGVRVVMVDRDEARLREAPNRWPSKMVLPLAADIGSEESIRDVGARVREQWTSPDIVVNNAAIAPRHNGRPAGILDVSMDEWLEVYKVNVTAAMLLVREFIPPMRERRWGRIVNVSSRAGRSNVNNAGPAYVTTKAALLGLTRSIACDFAADGITCNAVAPGVVASALTDELSPEHFKLIVDRTPLGRAGTAMELGSTIAFLASEGAGFITGACIDVNGGQSML